MSNIATIKDNHLHITYEYYDFAQRVTTKKILGLDKIVLTSTVLFASIHT